MSQEKHPGGCGCDECSGPLRPLKADSIVEGLDPEMCGGDGLAVFHGYLGDDAVDGVRRLYRNLELDEYLLIRERDIVAQRASGSASILWVRRDAVVRFVLLGRAADFASPAPAPPSAAAFLGGSIARRRIGLGMSPQDAAWLTGDSNPVITWGDGCPQSRTTKNPCC